MGQGSRFAVLALLVGLATGCSATYTQQPGGGFGPPSVMIATPGGFYPLYTSPPAPPTERDLALPPTLSGGGIPPAPAGGSADGVYNGTATLLQNDYGTCAFRFAMTNLHVSKGHVRFASFRGRINPEGGVRMADGSLNWIVGHFDDGHFAGTYTNRYCTYSLSLDRSGP
jgi:hypothetical protein